MSLTNIAGEPISDVLPGVATGG